MAEDTGTPPNPLQLTTLMMQVTEMRSELASIDDKIADIADIVKQITTLDKSIAEAALRQVDHSKQLNTLFDKLDAMTNWRTTSYPQDVATMRAYVDTKAREADDKAEAAQSGVNEIKTSFHATMRTLAFLGALFGGMLTAGGIWMVSTAVSNSQRLAVIEYQLNAGDHDVKPAK